ncbi:hypothetical protein OQA88_11544 [Cercophora sp. LCS_1]
MTLDELIQQYASLPIPVLRDAVIQAAASALHKRFNTTARGIASLYEGQRRLRSEAAGQPYERLLKADTEYFPLHLMQSAIENNGIESSKWVATLQGHAKEYNESRLKAPPVQAVRAQPTPSADVDTAGLPDNLQNTETKEAFSRMRGLHLLLEASSAGNAQGPTKLGDLSYFH